jgi:hypothetical protein
MAWRRPSSANASATGTWSASTAPRPRWQPLPSATGTPEAAAELAAVRRLLLPSGRLWLVYEPPGADGVHRLRSTVTAHLEREGFGVRAVVDGSLLGLEATPPTR